MDTNKRQAIPLEIHVDKSNNTRLSAMNKDKNNIIWNKFPIKALTLPPTAKDM